MSCKSPVAEALRKMAMGSIMTVTPHGMRTLLNAVDEMEFLYCKYHNIQLPCRNGISQEDFDQLNSGDIESTLVADEDGIFNGVRQPEVLTVEEFRQVCDNAYRLIQHSWSNDNYTVIGDRVHAITDLMRHRFEGERGKKLLRFMDKLLKESFAEDKNAKKTAE